VDVRRAGRGRAAALAASGALLAATALVPALPDSGLARALAVGGRGFDQVRDVAVDAAGNVYLVGGTESPDFPFTASIVNPGSPDSPRIRPSDVFVMKWSPSGKLLWSTRLGGPNYDRAYAVEVDDLGYVYVAGRAGRGFPVTDGAFQTAFQGGQEARFYGPQDGFVCKLTPDGARRVFCSYFGTGDPQIVRDLALDRDRRIFLAAGYRHGAYPPDVQGRFLNGPGGGGDSVIARVSPDGSRIDWARFVGGTGAEGQTPSIRVDSRGNPVLLTTTRSADAPTTPGAYDRTRHGGSDFYLVKVSGDGATLLLATLLGGDGDEDIETHNLALDAQDAIVVGGSTTSVDFPASGWDTSFNGGVDAVVAKLSADGSRLLGATFLGTAAADSVEGVCIDAAGDVHVTGTTHGASFPTTTGAAYRGGSDAFLVTLSPDLARLRFSTLVGGSGDDQGRSCAVSSDGVFYLGGQTSSRDLPGPRPAPSWPGGGPADGLFVAFRLAPGPRTTRPGG
jgi:hypothetical protein